MGEPKPTSSDTSTPAHAVDGQLALRVVGRDMDALGELYDRHAAYVIAISTRILGDHDEAQEVAQDVFWQLWNGTIRYEPERGRFLTWLYSMTKSRSIDRLRTRTRRQHAGERLAELTVDAPALEGTSGEERARIRDALAELPAEQREALSLCFFRGLSHGEAAEQLGAPLGTVKSRIKLAMTKLRARLSDLGEDL